MILHFPSVTLQLAKWPFEGMKVIAVVKGIMAFLTAFSPCTLLNFFLLIQYTTNKENSKHFLSKNSKANTENPLFPGFHFQHDDTSNELVNS